MPYIARGLLQLVTYYNHVGNECNTYGRGLLQLVTDYGELMNAIHTAEDCSN